MLDMEDESVADKKHTVEEERKLSSVKKKKNKKEGKSYDHDETNINDLIRHQSGITTYNQATRFGAVKFNHAVSKRIKESIFGHFYGVPDFKIRARLLDDLIGRYVGRYSFIINGKILEFSVAEFGQILGIPYRSVDVEMKRKVKSSYDWSLRHFAADCDIRQEVVVKAIIAINQKVVKHPLSIVDEDDLIILWIIYIFITVLCCKNSYRIGRKFLDYIANIEYIGEYNWAGYLRNVLFDRMRKCRDNVVRQKRTKEPSKVYIDGCVMCLMVWLFKHVALWLSPMSKLYRMNHTSRSGGARSHT